MGNHGAQSKGSLKYCPAEAGKYKDSLTAEDVHKNLCSKAFFIWSAFFKKEM